MNGSGTIQVIKRDGSSEPFDLRKLAASIWAAMRSRQGAYFDAVELARSVQMYVERIGWPTVSSAAIFEMTLKILRRVHFDESARAYETISHVRKYRRKQFRVVHSNGHVTMWDKSWLARLGAQSWQLTPRTARILASHVEDRLLSEPGRWASREDIIDMLNGLVAEFGLADAVPISGKYPAS